MQLFRHENRVKTEASKTLYAKFEIAYTVVDFSAAFCFIIGSVLFFGDKTQYTATWLFVIGYVFFAMKPTLRLWREIKLYRMGDYDDLAHRIEK